MKKLTILLLITTFSLSAAPVRLDFVFDDPNSTARTTGFIVFEENLVANPGNSTIFLPDPAVVDLQLTVTGSIASDGSYDINDYDAIFFDTNGGTLDFNQPLVGQATNNQPWGTTFDGNSGEFNLIASGFGPQKSSDRYSGDRGDLPPIGGPPSGCWYFTLCENGNSQPTGNDTKGGGPGASSPMELQSLQRGAPPVAQSVPGLSVWSTLALGATFLAMAVLFRRRLN